MNALAKWSPAPVVSEKRKAFTPKQKAIIRERQNWLCACGCGRSIKGVRHEFNHIIALALGGTHCIDNAEALLPDCHKPHTDAVKAIKSKADRQGGRKGRQKRSREAKAKGQRLWPQRPLHGANSLKAPPGYKHRWAKRKLETKRSDKI